jgi:hypothetical protein
VTTISCSPDSTGAVSAPALVPITVTKHVLSHFVARLVGMVLIPL